MSIKHQNVLLFPEVAAPVGWIEKLRAFAASWRHWTRDCYELRLLLAMDDHRLMRDMGASRYDVMQELRRPFWDWARRD